MMFPKQTNQALAKQQTQGKTFGQTIAAPQRRQRLDAGVHDVKLIEVDRNKLAENTLCLVFSNTQGDHIEYVDFLQQDSRSGDWGIDRRVSNLLAALMPNAEALDAFFAEVNADNALVLDELKGMECRIYTKMGRGYVIQSAAGQDGKIWVATDSQTGEALGQDADINQLKAILEAKQIRRAKARIQRYEATAGDENVAKFAAALAELHRPRATPATFAKKFGG